MSSTTKQFTLAEYLAYEDDEDKCYELVNGELVEMPPEWDFNSQIASYLFAELLSVVSSRLIRCKGTEIIVSGAGVTARVPDLMVLSEDLLLALRQTKRGTIALDMPPPVLVVEVVSPGKENENRDYRYKRSEYAARGIAEYWIVDPQKAQVMVLTLINGLYEATIYRGDEPVVSPVFPTLKLNAQAVLQAGEVPN